MSYDVEYSDHLVAKIVERFGPRRTSGGRPSELDFWSGPRAAAQLGFRDFERLPFEESPEVRTLHVFDRVLGPVVFVGVRVAPTSVLIDDFADDPDYWAVINDDPSLGT